MSSAIAVNCSAPYRIRLFSILAVSPIVHWAPAVAQTVSDTPRPEMSIPSSPPIGVSEPSMIDGWGHTSCVDPRNNSISGRYTPQLGLSSTLSDNGRTNARGDEPAWWIKRLSTTPSPRGGHTLSYDAGRSRVVLFSGFSGLAYAQFGTWEWDGASWDLHDVPGPNSREYFAAAYDTARGKLVLFGGQDAGSGFATPLNDTWEWDGSVWTQVATTGPPPRYGHAMAYRGKLEGAHSRDEAALGRVILFGGYNGSQTLNDTWEWDGTSWTQVASTGPPARYFHAMSYDSARSRVVMFGGYGNSIYRNDIWEWDVETAAWLQRSSAGGPSPRAATSMAYDSNRNRTVLFGGYNGSNNLGGTWEWNGTSWTQRFGSGPSPREYHAMAYDAVRGTVVLFGGYANSGYRNDLWEWNGTTWMQGPASPSPRYGHAMVYDAARGRSLLFGGADDSGQRNDTWDWDGATWRERSNSGPIPRDSHMMAYDSARQRVVMFGGVDAALNRLDDTWEWDGTAWTQREVPGPSPRFRSGMAYDASRGKIVLFGGYSGPAENYSLLGDTWEWDGETWARVATAGPTPRYGASMSYDAARRRITLFGGVDGPYIFNYAGDTWEWDGVSWTQVANSGPSPRWGPVMPCDSARGRIVLFGGATYDNGYIELGDTWEWNGAEWTQLITNGPSAASGYITTMAYDSLRGRVVLVGQGETWELQPDCNHNHVPDADDIAAGTSQDMDGDGVPDECSFWNTKPGSWSDPANWEPPVVPNNNFPPGRTYSANVLPTSADVTLNINATINTLIVAAQTSVGIMAGDLTIASSRGVLINGDLIIGEGHALQAGASFSVDGIAPLIMMGATAAISSLSPANVVTFNVPLEGSGLVTAAFENNSTIDADSAGQTLEIGGSNSATSNGDIRASNGGTLRINRSIGGTSAFVADGGIIDIPGATAVTVSGSTASVSNGAQLNVSGQAHLALTASIDIGGCGASRGCTPPVLGLSDSSTTTVGGTFSCSGIVEVNVEPAATFELGDNFDNRSTSPTTFHWESGPLTMNGAAPQTFEAAGQDLGPSDPAGFVDNFAMGTLRIEAGRTVDIVNTFDNIPPDGCEALYVDTLSLGAGSTLLLHECNVYYHTLIQESGATVVLLNGAMLMNTSSRKPVDAPRPTERLVQPEVQGPRGTER